MKAYEVNFDGLVGPTHNYSGLSFGNIACIKNMNEISNPRKAALEGLAKMKALFDLGLKQGILPPHERPDVHTLRRLGFTGNDNEVLEKTWKKSPEILAACSSASGMWTANAATVSGSSDTRDGKVHFTPANLVNKFHRSLESATTSVILRAVFSDPVFFSHHDPLPAHDLLGDEGAANHTRFCMEYGKRGIDLFVYGRTAFRADKNRILRFPARQTLEASKAVARLHGLDQEHTVFALQNPEVINEGVFHNDVIAVGNRNVFFFHEKAYANTGQVIEAIESKFKNHPFYFIKVKDDNVNVKLAVESYMFNSQLITLDNGEMVLILPEECRQNEIVWNYLQELIQLKTPVRHLKTFDLRQSMKNGGGPACLRLPVVLNEAELNAMNPDALMDDSTFKKISELIDRYYRDRLCVGDLADPRLLTESRTVLDELTRILNLGPVYNFQKI